jgi:RNA polymerase sigma factor (sigma-70 family)
MMTATISDVPADAADSMAGLLMRIQTKDPAAWDEILRRYGTLVSTTVRSFRLQEADTLDAIQMTWLRLAENAHRVQIPERLGGWLVTTARRECLSIMRQTRRGVNLIDVAAENVPDPSMGPEQRAIDAHTTRTLHKLIDELPPLRQTLIQSLFFDSPCSYDEIARNAGIPRGGIGPTRARALRQLRDKLDEHDAVPGDSIGNRRASLTASPMVPSVATTHASASRISGSR